MNSLGRKPSILYAHNILFVISIDKLFILILALIDVTHEHIHYNYCYNANNRNWIPKRPCF